ncbi:hypothetical protein [Lysinibacillus sp. TE18511]
MPVLSVALTFLSVALTSIRHFCSSFRRSAGSIRHFDLSFRRSVAAIHDFGCSIHDFDYSIRHFGSSFRLSDFYQSPWLFFPSVCRGYPRFRLFYPRL